MLNVTIQIDKLFIVLKYFVFGCCLLKDRGIEALMGVGEDILWTFQSETSMLEEH